MHMHGCTAQIAGLRSVLAGLAALPNISSSDGARQLWSELAAVLPPLPMLDSSCTAGPPSSSGTSGSSGAAAAAAGAPPTLAHAEYWSRHNNIENPELYAIFPYQLISLASNASSLALGRASYARRVSHGDTSEWQDCIQVRGLRLPGLSSPGLSSPGWTASRRRCWARWRRRGRWCWGGCESAVSILESGPH
jgi:hypothetical protein